MCQTSIETEFITAQRERIGSRSAAVITVSCLGNAVCRVRLEGVIPAHRALAECGLPDRLDLPSPLSPIIKDAIETALAHGETGICFTPFSVYAGFCLYLSEGVVQLTVWRQE